MTNKCYSCGADITQEINVIKLEKDLQEIEENIKLIDELMKEYKEEYKK